MDVKKYLSQIRYIDNIIKAKKDMLQSLRDRLVNLSPRFSPGGKCENYTNINADIISDIINLEFELNREIDKLTKITTSVNSMLDRVVNKQHRLVLTLRYINFMRWEEIAREMKYSLRQIHNLHTEALKDCTLLHTIMCYTDSVEK